jgi:hypothetical protein
VVELNGSPNANTVTELGFAKCTERHPHNGPHSFLYWRGIGKNSDRISFRNLYIGVNFLNNPYSRMLSKEFLDASGCPTMTIASS